MHQRIERDEDSVDDTFHRGESFIKLAILPELVDKWFSKQNAMPSRPSQDQDSASVYHMFLCPVPTDGVIVVRMKHLIT